MIKSRRKYLKSIRGKTKNRRGTLLIATLTCLIVSSSLLASTIRSALVARRETRWSIQMRQTELLLQAGVQRAIAKGNLNPDYVGEEWDCRAVLPRFETSKVAIRMTRNPESQDAHLEVIAEIGSSEVASSRTQRSRSFTFSIPQSTPSEKIATETTE